MASYGKQNKELQDKNKKVLALLLKSPENAECMDCTSKNPSWASVNLGVFLCARCAGLHRQLGVHVSQVRSTTLDLWEPSWINKMKSVGNEEGRSVYEAYLPPEYTKPSEHEEAGMMFRWLKTKYETKKYWKGIGEEPLGKVDSTERAKARAARKENLRASYAQGVTPPVAKEATPTKEEVDVPRKRSVSFKEFVVVHEATPEPANENGDSAFSDLFQENVPYSPTLVAPKPSSDNNALGDFFVQHTSATPSLATSVGVKNSILDIFGQVDTQPMTNGISSSNSPAPNSLNWHRARSASGNASMLPTPSLLPPSVGSDVFASTGGVFAPTISTPAFPGSLLPSAPSSLPSATHGQGDFSQFLPQSASPSLPAGAGSLLPQSPPTMADMFLPPAGPTLLSTGPSLLPTTPSASLLSVPTSGSQSLLPQSPPHAAPPNAPPLISAAIGSSLLPASCFPLASQGSNSLLPSSSTPSLLPATSTSPTLLPFGTSQSNTPFQSASVQTSYMPTQASSPPKPALFPSSPSPNSSYLPGSSPPSLLPSMVAQSHSVMSPSPMASAGTGGPSSTSNADAIFASLVTESLARPQQGVAIQGLLPPQSPSPMLSSPTSNPSTFMNQTTFAPVGIEGYPLSPVSAGIFDQSSSPTLLPPPPPTPTSLPYTNGVSSLLPTSLLPPSTGLLPSANPSLLPGASPQSVSLLPSAFPGILSTTAPGLLPASNMSGLLPSPNGLLYPDVGL